MQTYFVGKIRPLSSIDSRDLLCATPTVFFYDLSIILSKWWYSNHFASSLKRAFLSLLLKECKLKWYALQFRKNDTSWHFPVEVREIHFVQSFLLFIWNQLLDGYHILNHKQLTSMSQHIRHRPPRSHQIPQAPECQVAQEVEKERDKVLVFAECPLDSALCIPHGLALEFFRPSASGLCRDIGSQRHRFYRELLSCLWTFVYGCDI